MAPTTTTKTESDSSSGSSRPETDRESMHSKSKKNNNNNNSNNSDSNSNNSDSIPGGAMDTVTILAPTDRDVLCGRGKGIRFHPGNVLFNNLLRKHYHDYGKAPKGSKLEIVKKIVATIRQGQAGGIGMFLEQHQHQQHHQAAHDNNPNRSGSGSGSGSSGHYRDIGDERAMNKTAQAFRDIRVTEEKKHQQQRYRQQQKTFRQQQQQQHRFTSSSPPTSSSSSRHNKSPAAIDRAFGSVEHKNKHKHNHVVRGSSPLLVATTTAARRPTFRERIAMLQRQSAADAETDGSNFCKSKSNDGVDEESGSGSCSELDGEDGDDASVSDTETEDSFPMHRPPGHHTTTNKAMCWSVG